MTPFDGPNLGDLFASVRDSDPSARADLAQNLTEPCLRFVGGVGFAHARQLIKSSQTSLLGCCSVNLNHRYPPEQTRISVFVLAQSPKRKHGVDYGPGARKPSSSNCQTWTKS